VSDSDDIDAALQARASQDTSSGDDIESALAARAKQAPKSDSKDQAEPPSKFHKAVTDASTYMLGPIGPAVVQQATGLAANVGAGAKSVFDWATGKLKTVGEADDAAQQFIKDHTYTPDAGSDASKVSAALASPINPLNWPGAATNAIGSDVSYLTNRPFGHQMPDAVRSAGDFAGPLLTGAADVGVGLAGTRLAGSGPAKIAPPPEVAPIAESPRLSAEHLSLEQTPGRTLPQAAPAEPATPLTASSTPRAPSWEPKDANAPTPYVDSEPARGGLELSDGQRTQRAQILARVGLNSARDSALSGDRGNAATDFQLTKFNQEPAGQAAAAQFEHEKQALTNHAATIVDDTGGTLGTDENAMHDRGKTIDAPFKDLRQWFKTQSKNDYDTVKAQFGDKPVGQMEETQSLLKDPDFTETLLAKNQGHLLDSAQRQFDRFKALNPDGFTVDNAENFRKFLNQVWTPENSKAIGKLTDAIDSDVTKSVGSDVHESARARVQLKHQLLDDPEGVSGLFDHDPKTPLNRSTPFNAIPKELARLDPDQFKNVLDTLDKMPEELQPKAQAAKAEIKAQLANQLLDEGSKTQGQWNAPGVTKAIKANALKLKTAFGDDPQALQKIQDLDSAGRIIKVDQSYPGAAAQAANAVKRGMMSHLITRGSTAAGGMVGGTIGAIAGPAGAAGGGAIGAAAGEGLGLKAGQSMAEKAALKGWQSRVTSLSDLMSDRPSK
jgi:hypothetical protein